MPVKITLSAYNENSRKGKKNNRTIELRTIELRTGRIGLTIATG